MLRIAGLLRTRIPLRKVARAGLPNWDRPDPPPSARVPIDHELTDQQILFFFPDGSMPQFFLTQPEVYVGDTLLQSSPEVIKTWAIFLGIATLIGTTAFLMNPFKKQHAPRASIIEHAKRDQQAVKNKQWLKLGNQNPLGIKLTGQTYPYGKYEYQNVGNTLYRKVLANKDTYQKVNKQVQSYVRGLKQKAEKTVKQRLQASLHHIEHSSHQSHEHHSQGHSESHTEAHTDGHAHTQQKQKDHH